MIVHIFNNRINISQNLSSKGGGMHPIYVDGKMIANVIMQNDTWMIRLSVGFTSKDLYFEQPRLEPYKIYVITSNFNNESFCLVATPRYNQKTESYDLSFGQFTIGSDVNCDIYYPLDFSKNEFLRITLVGSRWFAETNSSNFFISGDRLVNGQEILNGDYIFFYGLKVIFTNAKIIVDNPNGVAQVKTAKLRPSDPVTKMPPVKSKENELREELPLYTDNDYFYKSPRFDYIIETAEVEVDEPPEPIRENEMPVILTLGPQLTMAGASALSVVGIVTSMNSNGNGAMMIVSVATMVVTMLGTLMWPMITRRFNRRRLQKRGEKRVKKYLEYLKQKKHLLDFIQANQRQTLLNNNPAPQACAQIIEKRSKELWQRTVGHSDFLVARLGLGKVPTKLEINRPKEQFSIDDDDTLFLAMKKTVNDALWLLDAPIVYDLKERNIDAVVGDASSVKKFLDCLFLQIMTFHSYVDLKIVVFAKDPRKWDYLKIAPHCFDDRKKTRYFATSVEKLSIIANELEKVFNARVANDEEVKLEDDGERHDAQADYKDFRPYYLFFIDDMAAVRNVPIINKILRYKRNLGFSIITTSQSVAALPMEVSKFICVSAQSSFVMDSDTNSSRKSFVADLNNGTVDMYACMQSLANTPIPVEKGKFELPASISFLELYNYGRVEQLNSLERWNSNNPSISLSVPIGIDQNNEIFRMDIHERAYGPHGLIAGTTGSGKSEWIVTYILSLAVNFSPDEVQFVLIDYKGGGLAKSFENAELGVRLPHLAGTITNLDKSEIFRSVSAIESELKRRQAVFNAAREKLKEGQMDIYKYQQYYRKGLVDEPMSHLLIICDEFAELKQQEPDFMDQLISTSRIGRSLGVHLILATQKPSGVVNDQIWSNSKFKVCLKVQDRSDSNEILRRPDAAYLKQTGTFYLQVGNDDYSNLGQVAWAGAKYYPSDSVKHDIDNSIQCIDDIGQVIATFKETEEVRENQGEELLSIVAYVSEVSKQLNLKERPLWLRNINPKIFLSDLRQKYHVEPGPKYTYEVIVGEYDEPRKQQQGALKIDLSGGNIAIIGKADSSIEKLLSAMIWSSIVERTPAEIAYYIIDFGTETMKKFAKFPHVGEVVFQDDMDKVAGVLNLITEEMDRRKGLLSDYNGSFEYYNKVQQEKLSLIVVVINNFDIYGEALPRTGDLMTELFRDAPRYGITFVVTANATNALGSRQMQFFNHVILMQLGDDSQYRTITDCRRGLIPKKVVGRGICKLDATNNDSYCEFQTALIVPEEKELEVIKKYADKCVDYYKCKVKQLTKVPEDISSGDLAKYVTDLSNVPIGFNLYDKDIAKYDFLAQKLHLFTGRKINIEFIYGLAAILSKIPNVKVRIIDMLGIFKKPILDIKMFNDNMDAVFDALKNDVLTRTETQDWGINLVIGAGSYKSHLAQNGVETFHDVFANLSTSKKSIYVMIDDYDKLRILQLEDWFGDVNVTRGIWLGEGFANQSMIEGGEVGAEDKKYNYPGLAFEIENGEYKVIKTMMDKDE